MTTKYAQPEIERRWLVRMDAMPSLASPRLIDDLYLDGGRLRLRAVRSDGAEPIYKLGKKYGRAEPSDTEEVVSIYLSQQEYESLLVLRGASLRKARHSVAGGALDVHEFPCRGLVIFEVEVPSRSTASAYEPPAFVGEEVTSDPRYSGNALARSTAPD